MLRFFRYLFEIIAALAGIALFSGLLLAWKLSSTPVASDFLTPYIKTGIENFVPNSKVEIELTSLTWGKSEHVLELRIENMVIRDSQNAEIANIPKADLKISPLGLFLGQIMPQELLIDHPQLSITRNEKGDLSFGDRVLIKGQDNAPSESTDFFIDVLAARLAHSVFMRQLAVTRVVLTLRDKESGQEWPVSIPEISIARSGLTNLGRALEYGSLDGYIKVEVTQKNEEASLDIRYHFDPLVQRHTFSSVFSHIIPSFLAGGKAGSLGFPIVRSFDLPLTGKISIALDKNLVLAETSLKLHGDEGRIVYDDFWDAPCPIKSVDLNVDYSRAAGTLLIENAEVNFNGPVLTLKTKGKASTYPKKSMDFVAELSVTNLPMNKYREIWPKPILPNPRQWLATNLRDGTFERAEVILNGSFSFDDIANAVIIDGSGKLSASGGTLTYIDEMPPVKGVRADATFTLKKMDVSISEGGIGDIRLAPFTLHISGLAEDTQHIDIPMEVSGPLPEVLSLLDHKPLEYAKALGVAPEDLHGRISGKVHFQFPLLNDLEMKDVNIRTTALAYDVASTELIPGIPVEQGNLSLDMDMSGFKMDGKAELGKAPFKIDWKESFDRKAVSPFRRVVAKGPVTEKEWNNLGISTFNGTKGPIDVTIEMTKPTPDRMLFSGALDMTPASLNVGLLNWKKAAGIPALLKFEAEAISGKPVRIPSILLSGRRVSAKGAAVFSEDMSRPLSLNFSSLIVGRTNTSITFEQDETIGGPLTFNAKGKSLDISGFREDSSSENEGPRTEEYNIQTERLYTSEKGILSKARIFAERDKQGWLEISLEGLADGDSPLTLFLSQTNDGSRRLKIDSPDFGKALTSFGFTNTIKGGVFSATGQSTPEQPRIVKGSLKIKDFTAENLPVLALLLNATSPFGFPGILTSSVNFSLFKGDFVWENDTLTMTRAHGTTSALGINIDGKIDLNSGKASLQGTLVPFSVINSVLNRIPLIGDLITGGKDQGVLAVAYEIKGSLNDPKIFVNPISLLTPGFIRNLFFGENDGQDETKK